MYFLHCRWLVSNCVNFACLPQSKDAKGRWIHDSKLTVEHECTYQTLFTVCVLVCQPSLQKTGHLSKPYPTSPTYVLGKPPGPLHGTSSLEDRWMDGFWLCKFITGEFFYTQRRWGLILTPVLQWLHWIYKPAGSSWVMWRIVLSADPLLMGCSLWLLSSTLYINLASLDFWHICWLAFLKACAAEHWQSVWPFVCHFATFICILLVIVLQYLSLQNEFELFQMLH